LNPPNEEIKVYREKNYQGFGSIDLLILFYSEKVEYNVLIEVKVHDYLSATPGQIDRYFQAAEDEKPNARIFIVYLTQYSEDNFPRGKAIPTPNTIDEYQRSKSPKDRVKHINWEQLHTLLDKHRSEFSVTENHMLELHKSWIIAQNKADLQEDIVGERSLSDYLKDGNIDPTKRFTFGNVSRCGKRMVWSVNLTSISESDLAALSQYLVELTDSSSIDRSYSYPTEEETLSSTKELLQSLTANSDGWKLAGFYSTVFSRAANTNYLLLNGGGFRGFSIKAKVENGEISIATFWTKKHELQIGLFR
jgi:hypothetical protein